MKNNIIGIKKAVSDLKAIQSRDFCGCYGLVYMDRDTREVWVNEYCDFGHRSWTVYHNPAIIQIVPEEYTMNGIRSAAEDALREYNSSAN